MCVHCANFAIQEFDFERLWRPWVWAGRPPESLPPPTGAPPVLPHVRPATLAGSARPPSAAPNIQRAEPSGLPQAPEQCRLVMRSTGM